MELISSIETYPGKSVITNFFSWTNKFDLDKVREALIYNHGIPDSEIIRLIHSPYDQHCFMTVIKNGVVITYCCTINKLRFFGKTYWFSIEKNEYEEPIENKYGDEYNEINISALEECALEYENIFVNEYEYELNVAKFASWIRLKKKIKELKESKEVN